VAAALRGTAAEIDASNAGPVLDASLLKLGQRLYGQPSPAGYAEPAAGWLGVGLLGRWQFGQQLAMARLPGVSVDPAQLAPNAATASAFVDGLLGALYGPDVDPDRRTALLTLVGDPQAPFDPASGAARQVLAYALAAQEASVR
jgi:hypothetical protein